MNGFLQQVLHLLMLTVSADLMHRHSMQIKEI